MSTKCGPGFASPAGAIKEGQREKILYVNCARHEESGQPNFLATVDVDAESPTYCQIIHQLNLLHVGDEVHRSGWNACSSCYGRSHACRSHLVLPCLNSSRIYILNMKDERRPAIDTVIEPKELFDLGVSFPHTSHCLADGTIMVSTVGDENFANKGSFVTIEGESFKLNGLWTDETAVFNADFWYQPRWNVMISGAWGRPDKIKNGFSVNDYENGFYGNTLTVWDWQRRKQTQTIELSRESRGMAFELRFLHDPDSPIGFATATFGSIIYRLSPRPYYKAQAVISLPAKAVANFPIARMPAFITALVISMDDRYLYCSSWFHGTVRQYDITQTATPRLVGQVFFGGLVTKDSAVRVLADAEWPSEPNPVVIKGRRVDGGPQMMQLSLDGKRLYVTTSVYSVWDKQFFPRLIKRGAVMVQVDVDTQEGGMRINKDFLVDFGKADGGPALANDMRYPGGDCSSDIWL